MDSVIPTDHKEQKTEKVVEHEGDGCTDCSWTPWNNPKEPRKETERTGNQRINWDHSELSIANNSLNT